MADRLSDTIGANDILITALRQYSHNTGYGLLFGYDKEETERIVNGLLSEINELGKFRDNAFEVYPNIDIDIETICEDGA